MNDSYKPSRGRVVRAAQAIVLAMVISCQPDLTTSEPGMGGPIISTVTAPVGCGTGPGDAGNSYGGVMVWNCWDTLVFSNSASALSGHLGDWNSMMHSSVSGAPMLILQSQQPATIPGIPTHRRPVTVTINGSGPLYCGGFDESTNPATITISTTTTGCGQNSNGGSLSAVFANELAGIVGYPADNDNEDNGSIYSNHCTRTIPTAGTPVNTSVCMHEAEGMLAVYGIRASGSLGDVSKHILTDIQMSHGSITMADGGTPVTVSVSNLVFEGGNPSLRCGEPALRGMALLCDPPYPDQVTYSWHNSNDNAVTMSGSGSSRTFTPEGVGTTTVTVDVSNAGPYAVATFFGGTGQAKQFVITVQAAPGGKPDLSLGTFALPDTVMAGSTINVTIPEVNSGTASTSSAYTVKLRWRPVGLFTPPPVIWWDLATYNGTNPLSANDTVFPSRSVTFPTEAMNQFYTVQAIIDPAGVIDEGGMEGNNTLDLGVVYLAEPKPTIVKISGDGQTGLVSTALPSAPSVQVRDVNNNGVSGVSVTFSVTGGGGSVTSGTVTTNGSGYATVGSWTLGSSAGSNSLGVSSSGLTGVSFSATGITGLNAPSSFMVTNCTPTTYGVKHYANYDVQWTNGSGIPGGTQYEIGENTSNSSGGASVIFSGGSGTTSGSLGPYLITPSASPRYFWVRHVIGGVYSSWSALGSNPMLPADGCLA